jgi:hypothetical protein
MSSGTTLPSSTLPTSPDAKVARFENFDDDAVFAKLKRNVQSIDSLNFVLDFKTCAARCAFNLDVGEMKDVLSKEVGGLTSYPGIKEGISSLP